MRNVIVGIVIGAVIGIVLGATVIAPRLEQQSQVTNVRGEQSTPAESPKEVALQLSRGLLVRPAVRLKMASAFSSKTPILGTLAKRVDSEIWRVSAGRIEIRFHEPDTLAPVSDMLDAVASSAIDAVFSSPIMWDKQIPAAQLFGTGPFGPGAEEYLAWVYFGDGRQLLEDIYHKYGVHSLICGATAPPAFGWFRQEIRVPEDFNGLRMQIGGLGSKVVAKLGAEPRQLTGGAIYAAIEAGKVDAVVSLMPAVDLKLGFQNFLKNYYFPGWQQPTIILELLINLEKWNGLTTGQKAQIEAVCGDNLRYGLAESKSAQFPALKELYASGVHLRRLPVQIDDALKQAWQEVVEDESRTDKDFRAVWRSLESFRSEYTIWDELSRP
jgi:TRAP-type mannitol/chloroaromatic compound transport system substrate-binding protein